MTLTANPSPFLAWTIVVACGIGALVLVSPTLLVLASFVGLMHFDMNMLFAALPALAAAAWLAITARGSLNDLLLPRPVLSMDADGILDRRVMQRPLPWSDVIRATSIVAAGGGVVFELRNPIPTFTMGTMRFEAPDAGAAHIAVRGLTVPPEQLARAILDFAAAAGADVGEASAHGMVRPRQWSV